MTKMNLEFKILKAKQNILFSWRKSDFAVAANKYLPEFVTAFRGQHK